MSCSKAMIRGPALAAVLAAAAALAGCAADTNPQTLSLTPTEHYGVSVTSHPEQIALGLHPAGLSVTQKAALGEFVSRWRDNGGGTVSLRAPFDSAEPGLARRMQNEASAYLVQLGVPGERVQVGGYVSHRAPGAPLLASYDRFEAQGPNCSGGWSDLTSTGHNSTFGHFGCAVTANFAAQLANPRDLVEPAVVTPADNTRRAVVLGKYRKGEVTSSARDDQASGVVSTQ